MDDVKALRVCYRQYERFSICVVIFTVLKLGTDNDLSFLFLYFADSTAAFVICHNTMDFVAVSSAENCTFGLLIGDMDSFTITIWPCRRHS